MRASTGLRFKRLALVWRKVVEGERKAHSQTGSKSDPIPVSVLTTQVWAYPPVRSRKVRGWPRIYVL